MKRALLVIVLAGVALGAAFAQRRWGGRGWGGEYDSARTAREVEQHGQVTPTWTNLPGFSADVFTFARIKRDRYPYSWGGGTWWTDAPDSDLNLSFRLQQITAMKVDPDGIFLTLKDEELRNYPFIYMVEPGTLTFSDDEVGALRRYLLNGGFLMLDDFWGEAEWARMEGELKKVFPDRNFVELDLSDPLYHCVFDIRSKGQVPNVKMGTDSQYNGGITWERPDATEVHHRVIRDDKGRVMVIATHNTDNGDGWEWEGDNHYYFETFSEKISYPLAINIIFYSMTH